MSLNLNTIASPSGARRITPAMLEARDRADGFKGLPAGKAKPFTYLAAFQEALPYLGLPPHTFLLVSWLVKQTMGCDWEVGSRPIAWPSARHEEEFLGLSTARVKSLNRVLFEAGIFVIRDNEQGKRYGRRGPDNRIIEAYGFDLSLLALRHDEFIQIAATARAERNRCKALRKQITIGRRAIHQAGEILAGLDTPLREAWAALAAETAALVAAARNYRRSGDLDMAVESIQCRQAQAEQWVKEAFQPVDTSPTGLENEPHITDTNLNFESSDTVAPAEESGLVQNPAKPVPQAPMPEQAFKPSIAGVRSAEQLIELFPRLEHHIWAPNPGWSDIVAAAGGALRDELGISKSLWAEACQTIGREGAAVALAIVSSKPEAYFTRGPGGYFAGMVRKATKGELCLDKTLWVLRKTKMGKASSRTASS